MSTYLTPQARITVNSADEPFSEETTSEIVEMAMRRILALMLQKDKPVHLAYGFPMEGDRVDIERKDDEITVGVEVALDRCYDPDYQAERLVLVKRALREYLAAD